MLLRAVRAGHTVINRSGLQVRYTAAFCGWLRGFSADGAPPPNGVSTTLYLIAACENSEEAEEVLEDIFEMIFQRELRAWHADEHAWPDTADFDLFSRWFTVESFPIVEDIGRGPIENDEGLGESHSPG